MNGNIISNNFQQLAEKAWVDTSRDLTWILAQVVPMTDGGREIYVATHGRAVGNVITQYDYCIAGSPYVIRSVTQRSELYGLDFFGSAIDFLVMRARHLNAPIITCTAKNPIAGLETALLNAGFQVTGKAGKTKYVLNL